MNKQDIRFLLEVLQRADCSTGYCCCGSDVNAHTFGDGHSPVDQGDRCQSDAIAILTAALAEPSEPVAEVAGDYNTKHIIFLPAGIALEVGDKLFTHPAPSKPSEPVMIYHGGCTIDCGEHGHHNMEMLKLIPAGTPLFTHPAPSKPMEPDKDLIQALTERDEYHDMADKLAEGIALHFDGDIGEHSSSNSPWDRALDLLDSAACAETMRLTHPAKPEPSEPVMIYHGGCTIDCGEHGHHNMEMLKLIPAGTKLFTHPASKPSEPKPYCCYCESDNEGIRSTYFDQTCEGCVKRMTHPASKPSPLTDEEITGIVRDGLMS